jgi:hypothetical protein
MYNAISVLAAIPKSQAQTDYLSFVIDGFQIYGDSGIAVAGRNIDIRNGFIRGSGTASSGGIFCSQDTLKLSIENVDVKNVNGPGIRNNVIPGSPLWSPYRPKYMRLVDSAIAGCTSTGVQVDQMQSVIIENNQIGANTLNGDSANESVQSVGINVGVNQTTNAVVCRGNFITTSGGGTQYANIGPYQVLEDERNGTATTSGNWITQLPAATVPGFGTPSGTGVIANFPGASATLAQTSQTVAQLISILKTNGILGA